MPTSTAVPKLNSELAPVPEGVPTIRWGSLSPYELAPFEKRNTNLPALSSKHTTGPCVSWASLSYTCLVLFTVRSPVDWSTSPIYAIPSHLFGAIS